MRKTPCGEGLEVSIATPFCVGGATCDNERITNESQQATGKFYLLASKTQVYKFSGDHY